MGGSYYITKSGDMWDYIAYKVYGSELYMEQLLEANENRGLLDIYIFPDGISVWCPYIENAETETEKPSWRDDG